MGEQATYYEAVGSVRGSCGHKHRTIRAAEACAERDVAACRSLPGGKNYSDRVARDQDGRLALSVLESDP